MNVRSFRSGIFLILMSMIFIHANCPGMPSVKKNTDQGPLPKIRNLSRKALSSGEKGCIYGNCVDGTGIFVYEEGHVYGGHFSNAERQGYGELYYRDGHSFTGQFFRDGKSGPGVLYFSNGDRYEGNFKDGNPEGEGIYYFSDGKIFTGVFSEQGRTASGKLKTREGIKDCSLKEFTVVCGN